MRREVNQQQQERKHVNSIHLIFLGVTRGRGRSSNSNSSSSNSNSNSSSGTSSGTSSRSSSSSRAGATPPQQLLSPHVATADFFQGSGAGAAALQYIYIQYIKYKYTYTQCCRMWYGHLFINKFEWLESCIAQGLRKARPRFGARVI